MKKNIILIGFMGSGKTTIGIRLAKELNYTFLDLDQYIEKKNKSSISDIFANFGETYFREEETKAIQDLQSFEGKLIATGGGSILREENRLLLKKMGIVIYLEADQTHIYANVKEETHRPLLQISDPVEKIEEMLQARKKYYEQTADFTVPVSGLSIQQILFDILIQIRGML